MPMTPGTGRKITREEAERLGPGQMGTTHPTPPEPPEVEAQSASDPGWLTCPWCGRDLYFDSLSDRTCFTCFYCGGAFTRN